MKHVEVCTPQRPRRKPVLMTASRRVSVLHRWLGVALCLMLALWFFTGSVLSFVPFPSLSHGDRIAGSEPIDFGRLGIEPAVALRAADDPFIDHARLISVAGQPRYVIVRGQQPVLAIDGQTGELARLLDAAMARAIAERFFSGTVQAIEGPFEHDQWTVHDGYVPYQPFYKAVLNDAAGTHLYVSARSGEVVQRTRRFERGWNYVGAVVHWVNVVPLRAHYELWRRVMWTLALGGIVLAAAGLFLGYVRYINLKRQLRPGLSPFSGLLRWHHAIGLFAGVLILSWVSSGWLSLDTGTFFSRAQPSSARIDRLRGMSLPAAAEAFPVSLVQTLGSAREVEFSALNAQPLLVIRDRDKPLSKLVIGAAGQTMQIRESLPDELVRAAVQVAWSPLRVTELRPISADDAYSLRGKPLPSTTRRLVLDDEAESWVQIDAATGQIVSVLDRSRRVYRWLVDGLHTFDFPLLNKAGSLWHVLLLIGTTSGFALSCTGVVLGFKRLRRSIPQVGTRSARVPQS